MSMWWSLRLRREAASVPLARRLLVGAMETAGVDPDVSFDLSLALTEACTNAVEHGGGPAGEDYRVTAFFDGERCRIEVIDSGPGFTYDHTPLNPTVEPAPDPLPPGTATAPDPAPVTDIGPDPDVDPGPEGGRGLFLIAELSDHVDIHNRPGYGAVVSFDKILKWRHGAPLQAA